jgi:hypothetical protein
MLINFDFRSLSELLIVETGSLPDVHLTKVELWANYAVVSNEERVKMGKCPRDMVIEQVQRHSSKSFVAEANNRNSVDIRMSHAIKALFWNIQNATPVAGALNSVKELSNYAAQVGYPISSAGPADPISQSSLLYENTYRLYQMGSDYFSLVQQFYHWTAIPEEVGYHSYTYSIRPEAMDPTGSTNYGKLTNVSLELLPGTTATTLTSNKYEVIVRSLNFNIVRVSGGALGLPVL